MNRPTPQAFLDAACKALESADWNNYSLKNPWTKSVVKQFGIATAQFATHLHAKIECLPDDCPAQLLHGEYLNLDLVGYDRIDYAGDASNNWRIRVALEHENDKSWRYELCKLCDVVANLRVLVYYTSAETVASLQKELDDAMQRLEGHAMRVTNCDWLFIVGPLEGSNVHEFCAFTLDCDQHVVPLKCSTTLNVRELKHQHES